MARDNISIMYLMTWEEKTKDKRLMKIYQISNKIKVQYHFFAVEIKFLQSTESIGSSCDFAKHHPCLAPEFLCFQGHHIQYPSILWAQGIKRSLQLCAEENHEFQQWTKWFMLIEQNQNNVYSRTHLGGLCHSAVILLGHTTPHIWLPVHSTLHPWPSELGHR